jgi:predicted SnoaL-like aldol condensation-catalyzing enzyme
LPHIPPGRDGLFNLVRAAPPTLPYDNSLIFAQDDRVMLHGCRFSGNGWSHNWVAADILIVKNGALMEHWDVLRDEATRAESVSGRRMFGNSFPEPLAGTPLTAQQDSLAPHHGADPDVA